jgi:hypothetical protein
MRLRAASISILIALAGVLAACFVGCEGGPKETDARAGAGSGAAVGAGVGAGLGAGVGASNDWGLVVRTWIIDDTRGTQVNVRTFDPVAIESTSPPPAGPTPDEALRGRDGRDGNDSGAGPAPSIDVRPLRPDWRAAIAAVAVAPPVDPATLAAWRANSIQIIGVPMERIAALESVLTKVGFRQNQDMGETPQWTQVCAGPEWDGEQRLVLDNGPVTLGPGRLRMLLRTWVVPGSSVQPRAAEDLEVLMADGGSTPRDGRDPESVPGAVRVEMAPQHAEASANRTSLADLLKPQNDEMRGVEGAARAGMILSRLTAAATLNGDTALLVLASDAGLQAVGDPTTGGGGGGWIAEKPDRTGATTVGPMMPGDMRLGPAILTSAPDGGGGGVGVGGARSWTVLILIPRAPDRYELLGL